MTVQSLQANSPSSQDQTSEFIKSPKLFLVCTQKFKPLVMLNFLRPFGAQSVTGRRKDPVVSSAEVVFDSCLSAEKAFAIWHCRFAVPFQGRVFFSRNPDPASREVEPTSPRLQVEGLPIETSELDLFDFFRTAGAIYSCIIEHSKKTQSTVAIIHYINPVSAKAALKDFNGAAYLGETLQISSLSEQDGNSHAKFQPPSAVEVYRVSVRGFPTTADVNFKDFFSKAGVILDLKLDQETGVGHVEYETAIGAFNAISRFNQTKLKGSTLEVKNVQDGNSPQPHAVIPLYTNDSNEPTKQVDSFVPASRNASQSRWADDLPEQTTVNSKQSKKNQDRSPQRNGNSDNKSRSASKTSENGTQDSRRSSNSSSGPKKPENSTPEPKNLSKVSRKNGSNLSDLADSSHSSGLSKGVQPDSKKVSEQPPPKTSTESASPVVSQPIPSQPKEEKPSQVSWEDFKSSRSYDLIFKLAKGLSTGADPIQEQMLESIYAQSPNLFSSLSQVASEFNDKLVAEEAVVKSEHQFYLSDDAYHSIIRSCSESDDKSNPTNPEYFPLYPNKEILLKQLMNSPAEESHPRMAAMVAKRLAEMEIPDHTKVAQELTTKCTLRLLMVSYYYDDVLLDLLRTHYPHLV